MAGLLRAFGRRAPGSTTPTGRGSGHVSVAALALVILVGCLSAASLGAGGSGSPAGGLQATPVGSAVAATASPVRTMPDFSAWQPEPSAIIRPAPPSAGPSCYPGDAAGCQLIEAPTPIPPPGDAAAFTLHVPILEYHRVKPYAGETGYAVGLIVPPELFAAQMDAMAAAGWHTVTMGQLGDDLRLGIQPPPKSFVVTFDDGYEDGFTYALPILRHDGFVATYFVVGGQIGHEDHLSAAELRALLAAGDEIGNHTMTHEDMTVMTPERLTAELYGTSALIAREIGVWPQSFAYPIGLTDPEVSAAVADTPGLETAVIQGGSKPETWPNRLELPRIRVGPGTYPQDLVDRAARYLP